MTNCKTNDTIPLFSTAYFPPLAMFGAMARYNRIYIEQKESLPKQTHRNRTIIITANGPMTLIVPLLRPQGTHTPTENVGISYAERWNILHLRAIETAYNASPFYLYYRDDIEKILTKHYRHLIELNHTILEFLFKKIKVDCSVLYTEDYTKQEKEEWDFREKFNYKRPDKKIICPQYYQVFGDRIPFNSNIGILDALFNLGPETKDYLQKIIL